MVSRGRRANLTVMATTDETAVAIARLILDDARIGHEVKGDGLRRFGGATFLGASLGPFMGQIHINVDQADFVDASELLQGLSGVEPIDR